MLELPAAAAIKAAIPLLRVRFLTNINQHLNGRLSVENGPPAGTTLDDCVPRLVNDDELAQHDPPEEPHEP